jgi:hypothetical protein
MITDTDNLYRTPRIKYANARHLYEVETAPGMAGIVEVEAMDRAHACRLAERAGYTVRSVNMVG